jgi:hypothetical protein
MKNVTLALFALLMLGACSSTPSSSLPCTDKGPCTTGGRIQECGNATMSEVRGNGLTRACDGTDCSTATCAVCASCGAGSATDYCDGC